MCATLLPSRIAMALRVAIHATGLMGRFKLSQGRAGMDFRPGSRRLIRIAGLLVLLHWEEIAVWALRYARGKAMSDQSTGFFFAVLASTHNLQQADGGGPG